MARRCPNLAVVSTGGWPARGLVAQDGIRLAKASPDIRGEPMAVARSPTGLVSVRGVPFKVPVRPPSAARLPAASSSAGWPVIARYNAWAGKLPGRT